MTAHDLTDLLERVAQRTAVGPPPLARMRDGVRRRRRRRAVLGGVGLSATVVAGTLLVPVLTNPGHDGRFPQSATTQTPVVSPPAPSIRLHGTYIVTALVRRDGRPAPTTFERTRLHMVFRNGTIRAFDGCNELSGKYLLRGADLHWKGYLGSTLVGCFPGAPPLFNRLDDVTSVARDQGGTYLLGADGHVVIALVRR
jgi:hypothetical protein